MRNTEAEQLLEDGELAFTKLDTHRRVRAVMAYKSRRLTAHDAALDELAPEAQDRSVIRGDTNMCVGGLRR